MSVSSSSRVAGLDVLRAAAILLVLGRHVQFPLTGWNDTAAQVMAVWMQGGWIGVDLFFVLSGFLVSGLLFREYLAHGTVSAGRFLVRRGLKIYPAFYVFLVLTLAIAVVHWGVQQVPGAELVSELFFAQSYWNGLWWHTWSLAVEEHFYLLLTALVFVLTRLGKGKRNPYRAIPYVSALVFAACLVARVATARMLPYGDRPHAFATHLRIDGLMFGVLLSYLWHFHREAVERVVRGRELVLLVIGIALFAPAFLFDLRATPFI